MLDIGMVLILVSETFWLAIANSGFWIIILARLYPSMMEFIDH
jgi:hypothetical protein